MKILRSGVLCVALLFVFAGSAMLTALPSMLNSIPTTDVIASKTATLMFTYYKYESRKDIPSRSSCVTGIEVGIADRFEIGFDFVNDKRFHDDGLYPTSFNFKWKVLSEDKDKSGFSLAVGSYNIGGKSVSDNAYKASPYIVFGKAYKDFRLFAGYQANLFAYKKIPVFEYDSMGEIYNSENKDNSGIILGADGVVIKGKYPVTGMIDYYCGAQPTLGVGLYQPINSWAWTYCYYKSVDEKLGITPIPASHWGSIFYTFHF
ncbi:MAG: hypothetical protein HQM10_18645 [Candidatus Riflebacteria bacterium]|nr:hypothetical protein [Candidatus Riflebacteria bacterium]